MGQALYRSYRSKKLSEIVGQEHITTTLAYALEKGTICHAYLFTGPRGVGKTSIARILAHEINHLPYEDGRLHLDIIEIDAASNRRIDEIRDLREKVHIAPTSAKYKVYIIDEVHMLTREAFNALLKTLEEPPAHVVFVLATTEVHKLPETIVSRTQRYAFKPVEQTKVIAHLRHIAEHENINITDEALELIAKHGEGSFRDSISLLDQMRNMSGEVTLTDVQAVLGVAPAELIDSLITGLQAHDVVAVAENLRHIHEQGYEPAQVATQLGASLRAALVAGSCLLPNDTTLKLLASLVQVPASPDPRIALEIALLDAALADALKSATPSPTITSYTAKSESKPEPQKPTPQTKTMQQEATPAPATQIDPRNIDTKDKVFLSDKSPTTKTPTAELAATEKPQATTSTLKAKSKNEANSKADTANDTTDATSDTATALDDVAWAKILMAIKQKHNTLYSLAKAAEPHFKPGEVVLELSFAFHQKQLNNARNKQKLCAIILDVTGQQVQLRCIVGEGKPAPKDAPPALPPADGEVVRNVEAAPPTPHQGDPLSAINNIFGGAEVLES